MCTTLRFLPTLTLGAVLLVLLLVLPSQASAQLTYPIVDTGQDAFFNDSRTVAEPSPGSTFYGQDAHYTGNQPQYRDNGDGTVTDLVTGLVWQAVPRLDEKYSFTEAVSAADTFSLAGYSDWRLPTIKELYSLIDFRGHTMARIPFIDTAYFALAYGDESAGERFIDAQYWSETEYLGRTMNGDATVFGVNFADGRIKGYPRDRGPGGGPMTQFVRFVRGGSGYGINDFTDNGDGTIADRATGLMWMREDSQEGMNWEDALSWAEDLELAGYDDWRLPNAKELQSIVDYSRAPDATESSAVGPAIAPLFSITSIGTTAEPEYPFYWTGTTHLDGPEPTYAAYVCFGRATGWMEVPPNSGNYQLWNVHGAGAQRSDPKDGDPADYPRGHGPQGDVIRIFNYVRAVRDVDATTAIEQPPLPQGLLLQQNYPNPFNPATTIRFSLPAAGEIRLVIHDALGRHVVTLTDGWMEAGTHECRWDASGLPSGAYCCRLSSPAGTRTIMMSLMK